jgi:hypothetical protein
MAERPQKRRGGMTPRDEVEEKSSREATRRATQHDVDADPREEDGWTQPESSGQKGAARDEEEG